LASPRPPLRVQICGALAIERDGQRLDGMLPGRQGRLLFTYLADPGRPGHALRTAGRMLFARLRGGPLGGEFPEPGQLCLPPPGLAEMLFPPVIDPSRTVGSLGRMDADQDGGQQGRGQ
jgi:hypothetical protein